MLVGRDEVNVILLPRDVVITLSRIGDHRLVLVVGFGNVVCWLGLECDTQEGRSDAAYAHLQSEMQAAGTMISSLAQGRGSNVEVDHRSAVDSILSSSTALRRFLGLRSPMPLYDRSLNFGATYLDMITVSSRSQ